MYANQKLTDSMNSIVSILIPVYNCERYLEQCLDSIVNQTYQHLQVVIVDDGSTDQSLQIAQSFARGYSFIEVYHQVNEGVATARNKLISLARGDYILFVDSDDWIEKDMIEQMLKVLQQTQVDIVVCGYIKDIGDNANICPVVRNNYTLSGAENVIESILFHKELNGSLWNKIVPRKFYEGLSFRKDIWYGEDCLFFWQALNRGVNKIFFMKDCYYHYRMNENSISHESFNYKKMSGHEVWKQINEDVHAKWPMLSNLSEAAYAVSDMWLLFYAGRDGRVMDKNLKVYQDNVRKNLFKIFRSGLIAKKKCIFAALVALNYKLGSKLICRLKY